MKIIVNKGKYNNFDACENVINYMYNSKYIDANLNGCCHTHGFNEDSIIYSFLVVKKAFCNSAGKQIHHIVLAFEDGKYTPEKAYNITRTICEYIGQTFQNTYVIHNGSKENANNLHAHIAINSVSYINGKKFRDNNTTFNEIAKYASTITNEKIGFLYR